MKRFFIFIIVLSIIFLIPIFYQHSIAYIEEGTDEYNNRKQEAINIIQDTNPVNEDENYKEYVYITDNSSKYHYYGCEELTTTPHKIELSEAINKGYYACDKCSPYISNDNEESNNIISYDMIIKLLFLIIGLLVFYIIIDEKKYRRNKNAEK